MSDPIARVEAALERLGAEYEPPPGWDTRVLTVVGQWHPWYYWWRRWRFWLAIPMGALGSIALLCWLSLRAPPAKQGLMPLAIVAMAEPGNDLMLEVRSVGSAMQGSPATVQDIHGSEDGSSPIRYRLQDSPATMRGSSANVGDRVHVTAIGRDRYRAIWVYHNDRELVVACPAGPSCNGSGDTLTADLTLQLVGRYIVLGVASSTPLPEPQGSLDLDRAAAVKAGAKIRDWSIDVP
jgi:hypothetical protein